MDVSPCTHRAKPAGHLCNRLASTALAPGSTVPETDATLLMSGYNLSVQPILPSLMLAGNAKQGAAGPGARAIPFPTHPPAPGEKTGSTKALTHTSSARLSIFSACCVSSPCLISLGSLWEGLWPGSLPFVKHM